MTTIKVLIAEDEELIRDALVALLNLAEDIEVIANTGDGGEALSMAQSYAPDIAVLDLQMPTLDGLQVAQRLASSCPQCGVIIVTGHGLPGHLKQALALGVRGFAPKSISGKTLAEVIRTVYGGGRYIDPELAADAIAGGASPLTPRETDVLSAAADGAVVTEVARRLQLSAGTVRNYLSTIMSKLNVTTRYEAVRVAESKGWI